MNNQVRSLWKQIRRLGFNLVTLGTDVRIFAAAISSAINAMRS